VNTVRGTGEIFESLADINNMPEWINPYALIYYSVNTINSVDNMTFEERYSIFTERAAREIVTEKSKKCKKRNKIS
jgi:hypothetical protein